MSISSSESSIGNPLAVPMLNSGEGDRERMIFRRHAVLEAARFLRRASGRRMLREPSMLVREAAAEHLEERQNDWAYSKPVVVLDVLWNLAFVAVAAAVLVLSRSENPEMPLRLWVVGYALQCVLHAACVCVEYQQRRRRWRLAEEDLDYRQDTSVGYVSLAHLTDDTTSTMAKHVESANTMFSFLWWIIGFYWVSVGGQALAKNSPQLYWLCLIFLAFDVFFVVFCIALACVVGVAVCCCLPCILAILYAMADKQEGATKEDVEQLPMFKFRRNSDAEKVSGEIQPPSSGVMIECGSDSPIKHILSKEDMTPSEAWSAATKCCFAKGEKHVQGSEIRNHLVIFSNSSRLRVRCRLLLELGFFLLGFLEDLHYAEEPYGFQALKTGPSLSKP